MPDVIAEIELLPAALRFANSPARFPALVTGMGYGKSFTLRKVLVGRMDQNRHHMSRKTPAFYLAPTYDMVHNLIVPSVSDDLAALGVRHKFSDSGHLLECEWRGQKCYTRLLSAENYERYMGPEVPFMLGDELELCFRAQPRKIEHMWRKLISRLRVKGATNTFNVASTPEGFGFLWEWWEDAPGKRPELRSDYALFQGATFENKANLPPGYIETLLRDYDRNLIQAYLYGQFINLTAGAVYYAFDRRRHVMAGTRLVPGLPLEFCFDFNVKPMTCVVSQYQAPDIVVHRCFQLSGGGGTEEMCRHLVGTFANTPCPALIYGDATGVRRQSSSAGKSDRQIIDGIIGRAWQERGYDTRWTKTNPWPPDRYSAVNTMLDADRVVIDEQAEGLITDLTRQVYKPGTRLADSQGETVGHAADGWGYRVFRDFPPARTIDDRIRLGRAA